jgi:hypothetical protein
MNAPAAKEVARCHMFASTTVHDNASFRDFIRDLGSPATARTVPSQPAFPPMDELARIAASHDLRPVGPPLSAEDSDTVLAGAS